MDTRTDQLAQLLRDTGKAHHQAFIAVDGADADWPLWYAEQLLKPVSQLTGFAFSKSELVYMLVLMSKELPLKAPGTEWAVYYAQRILEDYKGK